MNYIITPTWNCEGELARCARALVERTTHPVAWVVVENGSEPEHRQGIEAILSNLGGKVRMAQIIRNEENLGIPVAQNQALDWIAGQDEGPYWVLMLDADAEPSFVGWLEYLLLFAERHPEVGLIGGARSPHGSSLPVYYNYGHWYQHDEMAGRGELYPAECVDFATALFTWDILQREIRFDEDYLIYDGYDQDLAFRVRSWGLDVRQAEATVDHRPSSIMRDRDYQWAGGGRKEWDALRRRNVARFIRVWRPFLASQRGSIEEEMAHMKRMNRRLVEEADWRKEVPA